MSEEQSVHGWEDQDVRAFAGQLAQEVKVQQVVLFVKPPLGPPEGSQGAPMVTRWLPVPGAAGACHAMQVVPKDPASSQPLFPSIGAAAPKPVIPCA